MEFGLATLVHDLKHRRYRFRQALGGIMVVFLVILAQPAPRGLPIGVAVCILGEMVRLWAAGYVRKSRVLETRGPYAFVRHPQYLGNTLHAVGLCLASGHPWAISVWPVFFLLFYSGDPPTMARSQSLGPPAGVVPSAEHTQRRAPVGDGYIGGACPDVSRVAVTGASDIGLQCLKGVR